MRTESNEKRTEKRVEIRAEIRKSEFAVRDRAMGVSGLRVDFELPRRRVEVLRDLSVSFSPGKILGIIGESGSGKSVLGMAMLGILPPYARVSGTFFFEGRTFSYKSREQHALLGKELGFIPQSPQEALNPSRTVKKQLYEALAVKYEKKEWKRRAQDLLSNMGFSDPGKILKSYPYELSGGMQQRVLSAISVCCEPKWIIADEPTKGLDQKMCDRVADTLIRLRNMGVEGMIVITHDIHFAQRICDEVLVMYEGTVTERGESVLTNPRHPYTQALIESMPDRSLTPIADADPEVGIQAMGGCVFAPRCPKRFARCMEERPSPISDEDGEIACFLYHGAGGTR